MQKENYKAVRIKTETYKKIKLLADALFIPALNDGVFRAIR